MLFACTFILCVVWILRTPPKSTIDPTLYEGIGANLAAGNGFSFDLGPPFRPEITRTPFVPYLVAAVYTVAGRNPTGVLWLNAAMIAAAVALGYVVMVRVSGNLVAAVVGGIVVVSIPFIAGAAAQIGTEAPAMLQLALGALLLLQWSEHRNRRSAPWHAALLGVLLASLVLNRVNFVPTVAVAAVFVVVSTFRGQAKLWGAWFTVGLFSVALGAPVLSWSARNAALGLSFSPAPVGVAASRVYDLKRYEAAIFPEGRFREPPENRLYFRHWQRRNGPEELLELERRNQAWLDQFLTENLRWVVAASPARVAGLFSPSSIVPFSASVFGADGPEASVLRWVSRSTWTLSFCGLIVLWRRPWAKWLWLIPVGTLVPVHMVTVCSPRYMLVLLPLLAPYSGAAIVLGWRWLRWVRGAGR